MTSKKQGELAGIERPTLPEVDTAAAGYTSRMYKRRDLLAEEKQWKQRLLSEMKHAGVEAYKYVDGDFEIDIVRKVTTKETVVCTRRPIGADDEDAEIIPLHPEGEDEDVDDDDDDDDDWADDEDE